MEQKVVITESESEINSYLSGGWFIKSVTAQHVAASTAAPYSANSIKMEGKFCFVLER